MSVDEGIQSDSEVVQAFVDRNKEVCQMQLIIDWLEKNELDDMLEDEDHNKIEFFSQGPHYWENTLYDVMNKQRRLKAPSSLDREFCEQLDPDAPARTKKPLHDLDKEDEARILKYVFRYLRTGQLIEGQELAQKLGFHWLAAALDGWLLHHDANINERNIHEGEDSVPIDGNSRRDLWKYVCWENAKLPDVHMFEKAVFGILSGNVSAALPVCYKWTDKLWAFYRASVDVKVEKELRDTNIPKPVTARNNGVVSRPGRTSVEMPAEYWKNERTDEQIFQEVDALMSESWSPEEKCHSLLQRHVAVNNVDTLLDVMINWINVNRSDDQCYTQMLRFFAHLALFLKRLEIIESTSRQQMFATILEAYISFLIEKRMLTLVATYVAALPKERQVANYSKLLSQVTDPAERQECVVAANEAGLDIDEITKVVVQTNVPAAVVSDDQLDFGDFTRQTMKSKATAEDLATINSLDWLMINCVQYIELLKQGNAIMRAFALSGKLDAARAVLLKMPSGLLEGVLHEWKGQSGVAELSSDLTSFAREYQCFRAYFEAMDTFDSWLRFFHNSKPEEPVKPTSKKFTDIVAYEHKSKGYEADMKHYKEILANMGQTVARKIVDLLCFPEGGWLRDPSDLDAVVEHVDDRTQKMNQLRRMYIPQLTLIAHTVLHSSSLLRESVQLADIVASEDHRLYKEFTTAQLQDFLRKIRESSLSSLNEGLDALGYVK